MKYILCAAIMACSMVVVAQRQVDQVFPVQAGQKVELVFDHPQVKIRTWNRREVKVTGTVSINRGEHDDAFELKSTAEGDRLKVVSVLKDEERIPSRILIRKGDQDFYFRTDDMKDVSVQKFLEENGRSYQYMSKGVLREMILEVYVPEGVPCVVYSKYGLVEVMAFNAPLQVTAVYGAIDASIAPQTTSGLRARTRFGEILTNLKFPPKDVPPSDSDHRDQWTEVSTLLANRGNDYFFESKFGNVYLRRTP